MSDRVKGFVVTLERDIRDDDAEGIRNAICMIREVCSVQPIVVNPGDHIERMRIRAELEKKLYQALEGGK